ncbi:MAG: signal peptide peptidase SppA [Bacteroidetes bacterium]|nr:signal peptide peptidase SppA [Bacteroidota bacterium]
MNRILVLCTLLFFSIVPIFAQSNITPYFSRNTFQLTSPGTLKFGLYGYDNPALLSYVREPDLLLTWSDNGARGYNVDHWGVFAAVPNFGIGVVREKILSNYVADYTISLGGGDRSLSAGISYNWTTTNNLLLDKSDLLTLGALFRPVPFVSLGAHCLSAMNAKGWETIGEVGFRPFGDELLTAFAEYVLHRTPQSHQDFWSMGVAVEALPGIRFTGRYFDNKAFNVGFQFSLGDAGVEMHSHYDANGNHSSNTFGIRYGAHDRTLIRKIIPAQQMYVGFDLNGTIGYQRFEYFDKTKTLTNILEVIEASETDPSVAGIAINTSGMNVDREKLWEIREKLKECKNAGKKIIIYIDRGNIDLYHFASIADNIVMDPVGTIMLDGYLMGNTYLKGMFEKIGIGFEEWRFFKYKSANETLSHDKMSDADREQRQAIIDDWYEIAKKDICVARNLSPLKFDSLVNLQSIFLAHEAKELGLIDSIGRWEVVNTIVKAETGKENGYKPFNELSAFQKPYDAQWGEPPQIAVIYVLGTCAMDEGIKARSLVKVVEGAMNNSQIKAVVLRIDSPGGDAMASDYIAEAMRKAKGKKPIIVSQGFVAGSGGYWLSMYADTIVAAPGTITGSIGVIGGWAYNKNLKETLGLSTDFVKRGEHADLGFGIRMPFIGLGLPDRNLTTEEHVRMEYAIKFMYKEFVTKVSEGRKMSYEHIDSIGQGRIWSGVDGKQNGLIDILGGMETAISIAKERAGILKDQKVTIIEMPKKGFFDFNMLMPKFFGVKSKSESIPALDLVIFRLQHNGEPIPMMPFEDALTFPGK